jgi:hypothetical protein
VELTIPNATANLRRDGNPAGSEPSAAPASTCQLRYLAGDWALLHEHLEAHSYDLILTSDTVYSVANLPKLYQIIKHVRTLRSHSHTPTNEARGCQTAEVCVLRFAWASTARVSSLEEGAPWWRPSHITLEWVEAPASLRTLCEQMVRVPIIGLVAFRPTQKRAEPSAEELTPAVHRRKAVCRLSKRGTTQTERPT